MCAFAPSALSAGVTGKPVRVLGSVSGKTLIVDLRAQPRARCSVWLGAGENRQRLPRTVVGVRGRGRVEWPIPSDSSTGTQALAAACGLSGVRSTGVSTVDIPESAVATALTTVLNILLDVILGATLIFFLVLVVMLVVLEPDRGERFIRGLALVAGALVALGAQAAGVGFADYAVDALTGTGPGGQAVELLSIVIPGGVAAAFGWFFLRAMRHSTAMALRWMSFLGMLTVVSFIVIFAQATSTQGVFLGSAAIPNTSFVVGLIFSVIAFRRPEDAPEGIGFVDSVTRFMRRGIKAADTRSGGSETRNPFADD